MEPGTAFFIGIFTLLAIGAWRSGRREQREMELRYELYGRMVEHPGPEADRVRALLEREDEKAQKRKEAAQESQIGGGIITLGIGVGLGVLLYYLVPDRPVYLMALGPTLVGVVLLMGGIRHSRKSGR